MKAVEGHLPLARRLTGSAILLLATLLRSYHLSGQSLWSDEGNSVALAHHSFAEIAQRTAFDIHPPLYYWLLKIWISLLGDSEIGLRSLSVIFGVLLVYLIGIIGTRYVSAKIGLTAAFIAALSPFQVYYAQEARMYMMLTFLSSLTVLLTFLWWEEGRVVKNTRLNLLYLLTVTAGLYTHYTYPLILAIVNLTSLLWFWQNQSKIVNQKSKIAHWFLIQLLPLLLYLPWLPTAWRQITTWPSEQQSIPLANSLREVSTILLFGLSWPFDPNWGPPIIVAIVILITLWFLKSSTTHRQPLIIKPQSQISNLHLLTLLLWLLVPILLTLLLFSPAFLKFLLIATPPLVLLLALTIHHLHTTLTQYVRRPMPDAPSLIGATLLALLLIPSALSLHQYFTNPRFARDNYRGIVNFIKAVGGPEDSVILNAEGQQDVFNYYFEQAPQQGMPIYPLPRHRPLDELATRTELQQIQQASRQVYAVYWATQQADPTGQIEGWLDANLFKATDQWYGNVRLVSYATAESDLTADLIPLDYRLGQHIRLTGYNLSTSPIVPGNILQLALHWETDAPLAQNYTVFAQLLDPANHVVGQRDAAPSPPTTAWSPLTPSLDTHGLFIEPGTPPGQHRLIVGLYDSQTSQRLPVFQGNDPSGDFVTLTNLQIERPAKPLPSEAFTIQNALNVAMGDVTLVGYDLYKLGHRSSPDTPLHPGDPVQVVLYWQGYQPVYWLEDQLFIQVVSANGRDSLTSFTRQPAGVDYPIKQWQPGEIVRAQHGFFLDNVPPGTYRLAFTLTTRVGHQRLVALSEVFRVIKVEPLR